jgi:hypothetical protein
MLLVPNVKFEFPAGPRFHGIQRWKSVSAPRAAGGGGGRVVRVGCQKEGPLLGGCGKIPLSCKTQPLAARSRSLPPSETREGGWPWRNPCGGRGWTPTLGRGRTRFWSGWTGGTPSLQKVTGQVTTELPGDLPGGQVTRATRWYIARRPPGHPLRTHRPCNGVQRAARPPRPPTGQVTPGLPG